jgi:hypothetical protein
LQLKPTPDANLGVPHSELRNKQSPPDANTRRNLVLSPLYGITAISVVLLCFHLVDIGPWWRAFMAGFQQVNEDQQGNLQDTGPSPLRRRPDCPSLAKYAKQPLNLSAHLLVVNAE